MEPGYYKSGMTPVGVNSNEAGPEAPLAGQAQAILDQQWFARIRTWATFTVELVIAH